MSLFALAKLHVYRSQARPGEHGLAYRYDDGSVINEAYLREFPIIKFTKKGFWIKVFDDKRFILSSPDGKRYAYLTDADALKSYLARKKSAVRILTARLDAAKERLRFVEEHCK